MFEWLFGFLVGICFFWAVMKKLFNRTDWRIILPLSFFVISIIAMAAIYPGREEAQMEFGFFGLGILSLPFSILMPFLRDYFYSPVCEILSLDYCSEKVFSIGFSLLTLGCIQYFLIGTVIHLFSKHFKRQKPS